MVSPDALLRSLERALLVDPAASLRGLIRTRLQTRYHTHLRPDYAPVEAGVLLRVLFSLADGKAGQLLLGTRFAAWLIDRAQQPRVGVWDQASVAGYSRLRWQGYCSACCHYL